MRGVARSSSPAGVNLGAYQGSGTAWSDLAGRGTAGAARDYDLLLRRLHREFSGLCAFCERVVRRKRGFPGPVEHFRPRNPATGLHASHFGRDLTFDWLNLMYACPECQVEKGNKWPGTLAAHNESLIDGELARRAREDGWTYRPVPVAEGYVDPNRTEAMPAEDYFEYDESRCRISPSLGLSEGRRSKALRTIHDIGLDRETLSRERRLHVEEIKQHVGAKAMQRRSGDLRKVVRRHSRRRPDDMKSSLYAPAVRFTGLVLYAFRERWFERI